MSDLPFLVCFVGAVAIGVWACYVIAGLFV